VSTASQYFKLDISAATIMATDSSQYIFKEKICNAIKDEGKG
jgi:hypothetical protein